MIVVTGGAGFIGANLVKALNARGQEDILVVDNLSQADKFINLRDCRIQDYMDKRKFDKSICDNGFAKEIEIIYHQGACSDTMATDGHYVMENNYRFSRQLYNYCQRNDVRLIYASSASVYGDNQVFKELEENEKPLNIYAYSKLLFDQYVRRNARQARAQVVGLRYFNVYGPREQHKNRMASVAFHFQNQWRDNRIIKLFCGSDGYADGDQRRDFVHVYDIVDVNLFFASHPEKSGIFNVGTGRSQCFNDVAMAVINTMLLREGGDTISHENAVAQGLIQYIPMPLALAGKYQSFTEADIENLRHAGYQNGFLNVEQGVGRYIKDNHS